MKFYYIRKMENPPRGVITLACDGKSIALVFCSPKDQWTRAKGRKIAAARLAQNPIRVEQTRGTDVLDQPEVVSAALSLICDRPGWSRTPISESRTWNASTIGPDGSMFHFRLATNTDLPEVPRPVNISWLRIPTWAQKLVADMPL
jgi:hypothetical protein